MPANLTIPYKKAEEAYRKAHSTADKLQALKEMMATIPKHKGTEKLQADIKKRMAKLKEEPRKKGGGGKRHDPAYVPSEGVGQIVLAGYPNAGKSQFLATATNAHPEIAPYPYTTRLPQPGIMFHKEVRFQLVDGPALSDSYMETWYPGLVRYADLVLVLLDLAADDLLEQWEFVSERLLQSNVELIPLDDEEDRYGSVARKRTLAVANKIDLDDGEDVLAMVKEVIPERFGLMAVSALEGWGMEDLKTKIFDSFEIIRVFSKIPNQKADLSEPFVFHRDCSVIEAAETIHKDFAQQFKSARIWREGVFQGQRVQANFVLEDADILEIQMAGM